MFELIIGIIIGATFAEFWRHFYRMLKRKTTRMMDDYKSSEH